MSNYVQANAAKIIKITKTFTDFSTAALTNTIALITLPAKSIIYNTVVSPTTAFTGGIISAYVVSVDVVSVGDLIPNTSVFTVPTRPYESNTDTFACTIGSTEAVFITATSVTGLLNAATQGSVDIYLTVGILP